jgi:hypothetical protein
LKGRQIESLIHFTDKHFGTTKNKLQGVTVKKWLANQYDW